MLDFGKSISTGKSLGMLDCLLFLLIASLVSKNQHAFNQHPQMFFGIRNAWRMCISFNCGLHWLMMVDQTQLNSVQHSGPHDPQQQNKETTLEISHGIGDTKPQVGFSKLNHQPQVEPGHMPKKSCVKIEPQPRDSKWYKPRKGKRWNSGKLLLENTHRWPRFVLVVPGLCGVGGERNDLSVRLLRGHSLSTRSMTTQTFKNLAICKASS